MSQNLPVNNYKWIKDSSQFSKEVMKDILLKLIFNIPKKYMNFMMIYHFYLKE